MGRHSWRYPEAQLHSSLGRVASDLLARVVESCCRVLWVWDVGMFGLTEGPDGSASPCSCYDYLNYLPRPSIYLLLGPKFNRPIIWDHIPLFEGTRGGSWWVLRFSAPRRVGVKELQDVLANLS